MTANDKPKHAGLYEAVLAVQAAAETLPKDGINPHFKSKYTPLDTIVEKVGPLLAQQRAGVDDVPLPGRQIPAAAAVPAHARRDR